MMNTGEECWVWGLLTGWIVGEQGASLIGLSVLVKSEGGAWKNKDQTPKTNLTAALTFTVEKHCSEEVPKQESLVSPVENSSPSKFNNKLSLINMHFSVHLAGPGPS